MAVDAGQPTPPTPTDPERRPSPWVWLAVAGVLALIVVIAVIALTREDEPRTDRATPSSDASPPGTPASPATTAPPAAAPPEYQQLVARLPGEVTSCQPRTPQGAYAQAITQAGCVLAVRPDIEAQFTLYASQAVAADAYQTITQQSGYTPNSGDCTTGVEGETAWARGGQTGRLSCGQVTGVAAILWSTDGVEILGQLTASAPETSGVDLYVLWEGLPRYNAT